MVFSCYFLGKVLEKLTLVQKGCSSFPEPRSGIDCNPFIDRAGVAVLRFASSYVPHHSVIEVSARQMDRTLRHASRGGS